MKAIVGIVPNLPWWRLQNMSDEEIEAFNKKHLVEIDSVGIKARPTGSLNIYAVEVWNEAIEAAIAICDKAYENATWSPAYQRPAKIIGDKIRKLKK